MSVLSSVLGAANGLVNWFLPKESKRALSDTRVETSFIFLHLFGPLMAVSYTHLTLPTIYSV